MSDKELAEKGGSRTLRGPYGPQTGFEDQRHHRAPSFSTLKNQLFSTCTELGKDSSVVKIVVISQTKRSLLWNTGGDAKIASLFRRYNHSSSVLQVRNDIQRLESTFGYEILSLEVSLQVSPSHKRLCRLSVNLPE